MNSIVSWRAILRQGLSKGWSSALWMYKILIPVSFFAFLVEAANIIDKLHGFLGPAMHVIHLPAKAAMPLLAGLLTGTYGGIAAMSALSFTIRETTLISVYLLISHALIQESIIQGQSGMHPIKAAALRLTAATAVVWLIGFFWQGGTDLRAAAAAGGLPAAGFVPALKLWSIQTLKLNLQILVIVIAIMIIMEWMKARHVSERIAVWLGPVLRIMGLSRDSGLLWLTAVIFGLAYGGAVIVSEAGNRSLSEEELRRLHVSIGINHSMIEDPALFMLLGVGPLWLWLPRLGTALLAVHLMRLFGRLRAGRLKPPLSVPCNVPHTHTAPGRSPR